jgi:hypothetical protein
MATSLPETVLVVDSVLEAVTGDEGVYSVNAVDGVSRLEGVPRGEVGVREDMLRQSIFL